MKWVTRERPKIDRIACPWLVTGGPTDVQFDKLDAPYYFGLAAFDNA